MTTATAIVAGLILGAAICTPIGFIFGALVASSQRPRLTERTTSRGDPAA